jgi:PKD repeat protein
LRVYDSRGATGTSSVTISVTAVNQPPVAHATATPSTGNAPLVVAFSSAGSQDPDGAITAYHWDFGDAIGSSNIANPNYTYNYPGTYNATLTVWDNNNISNTASVLITVNTAPATLLRSTAITLSGVKQGKKVSISGQVTVRNSNNVAVSGATVSVTWTKPGGSTVTQSANTNSSGVASFNTTGVSGTYKLTINNIAKTGCTFDAANSILSRSITK